MELRDFDPSGSESGPREMVFLPLSQTGSAAPLGVLVAAASPRKRLDESYRTFLSLVASQIAKGVADAQAYRADL